MPKPHGLPHRERMVRRRDFERAYRNGSKRVGPYFISYVVRQPGEGRKFGVAVSRKVGKAVQRNRLKRHLREIYRHYRPDLREDVQCVLVARPQAVQLDFDARRNAVLRLWRAEGDLLDE